MTKPEAEQNMALKPDLGSKQEQSTYTQSLWKDLVRWLLVCYTGCDDESALTAPSTSARYLVESETVGAQYGGKLIARLTQEFSTWCNSCRREENLFL